MPEEKKPYEDMFHKYPVLRIPTGKRNEELIVGVNKAYAILKNINYIEQFVMRHGQDAQQCES